jgi:hypothetical protein
MVGCTQKKTQHIRVRPPHGISIKKTFSRWPKKFTEPLPHPYIIAPLPCENDHDLGRALDLSFDVVIGEGIFLPQPENSLPLGVEPGTLGCY